MDFLVGQKVYIKSRVNNFRLLSYSGEVVHVNEVTHHALVRLRNNDAIFVSELNLSSEYKLPSITSFIFMIIIFLLFFYPFAYFVNIHLTYWL